ncbi:hypothetical protein [Desulforamulus aquiferis]|nr:hypothetical protein [Desulforamulus aquiferis]
MAKQKRKGVVVGDIFTFKINYDSRCFGQIVAATDLVQGSV